MAPVRQDGPELSQHMSMRYHRTQFLLLCFSGHFLPSKFSRIPHAFCLITMIKRMEKDATRGLGTCEIGKMSQKC